MAPMYLLCQEGKNRFSRRLADAGYLSARCFFVRLLEEQGYCLSAANATHQHQRACGRTILQAQDAISSYKSQIYVVKTE